MVKTCSESQGSDQMEKTLATAGELIARVRADYATGPRHEPLGGVEVVNQGEGRWMAYADPPLEHNDDKRAFLAAVARAKRDHDLADE